MTMRITSGMTERVILADLREVSARLTRAQQKAASGKELTRPSDNPFGVSRALDLDGALAGARQYQRTISDSVGWQQATETTLAGMTDTVQRVRELVIQGSSGTLDSTARAHIAGEIDQLIDELKQQANSNYQGRYIFAGTANSAVPYGSADTFLGDNNVISREIGPGVSLQLNVSGSSILGSGQAAADGKLLNVLRDIADHLRNGDTASLRSTDLARLDSNFDTLIAVRAENGSRTQRLEAAGQRLQQTEEVVTTQLSQITDADMAQTLIDLTSQQAAYQAALRAGATILQASLMDFLR